MASGFVVNDYKCIVRDLWDSEEFKINSKYSETLKNTVEKICSEGSAPFEQCFLEVTEAVERMVKSNDGVNKEQPNFRDMYLYLAKELPKVLEKLSSDYNDPILWQVLRLFSSR